MKIAELFRRDIHRTVEEVVKVDLADEAVIANELDEYVATDHILDEFEEVLNAYQESINSPNESCTIWVSGFFGSGKSSWAKILGYLLGNPTIAGSTAVDRFFERTRRAETAGAAEHDSCAGPNAKRPAQSGDRIERCRSRGRKRRSAYISRAAGAARLLAELPPG